jgi:hypothetical protein
MLLNLVELLNLTFEHELGSNRDSNVKFAPLSHVRRFKMQAQKFSACVQAFCSAADGHDRRRDHRNDGRSNSDARIGTA